MLTEIVKLLIGSALFTVLLTLVAKIGRDANADTARLKDNVKGQKIVKFIDDIYSCKTILDHVTVTKDYVKSCK